MFALSPLYTSGIILCVRFVSFVYIRVYLDMDVIFIFCKYKFSSPITYMRSCLSFLHFFAVSFYRKEITRRPKMPHVVKMFK